MKRQSSKILMIVLQFLFYFLINKIFNVPDRIMYNTFFIYLALNFTKNMYSFKTILIWEELKKQLFVHTEYLIIMLIGLLEHDGNAILFGDPADQMPLVIDNRPPQLVAVQEFLHSRLHHHVRLEGDRPVLHIIPGF